MHSFLNSIRRVAFCTMLIFGSLFLTACGDDAFTTEDDGGAGPIFEKAAQFSGIYSGELGNINAPYFSYARLFITSTGEGFVFSTTNSIQNTPQISGELVAAFSIGSNQVSLLNNDTQIQIKTAAFHYNTNTNEPNPKTSTSTTFEADFLIEVDNPTYAEIQGTSISAATNQTLPAVYANMQNDFNFIKLTREENIKITLALLEKFNPWNFSVVTPWGFSTNDKNLGVSWSLITNADGSFDITFNESPTGTPSNCNITDGKISLLSSSKNEFVISFSLSGCNDLDLHGQYSGVGFLSNNPNQATENYGMSFAVKRETSSSYLSFFGGRCSVCR